MVNIGLWGEANLLKALRIMGVAALSLALGGCLTFGRIESRGTSVNVGIGAMQNRAILLNLARASRGEPLYFLSITQVQAQGAADLRLTAPGFNVGAGQTLTQKLLAFSGTSSYLDNSTNTNMQVGVYNTQAFYSGMLQPLGLELHRLDPGAIGLRRAGLDQRRRTLERAPQRAQRNDCGAPPGLAGAVEGLDLGARQKPALARAPEQEEEQIDVDPGFVLQPQARIRHAGEAVEIQ